MGLWSQSLGLSFKSSSIQHEVHIVNYGYLVIDKSLPQGVLEFSVRSNQSRGVAMPVLTRSTISSKIWFSGSMATVIMPNSRPQNRVMSQWLYPLFMIQSRDQTRDVRIVNIHLVRWPETCFKLMLVQSAST